MIKLSIMKMRLTNIWRVLICIIVLASCSEDKLSDTSVFGDPITEQNEFDKWIYKESKMILKRLETMNINEHL